MFTHVRSPAAVLRINGGLTRPHLFTLHVEYAGGRMAYGILFIFSLFCEYSNLEYVHIHATYRVNQAKSAIRILVAASQEYVNTYSTRRLFTRSVHTCSQPGGGATHQRRLHGPHRTADAVPGPGDDVVRPKGELYR